MESFRQKQIKEFLDEDKNIRRQVYEKEKEQVRVMDELVKPRPGIDTTAEIKNEQLIELLKKAIEAKSQAVELLIGSQFGAGRERDAERNRLVSEIARNGEVVRLYNDVVRNLIKPDNREQSRDLMKSKISELEPLINTITYGIDQVLEGLGNPGGAGGEAFNRLLSVAVPQLLGTKALFLVIGRQIYTGTYEIIDQRLVDLEYNKLSKEKLSLPAGNRLRTAIEAYELRTGARETEAERRQQLIDEERRAVGTRELTQQDEEYIRRQILEQRDAQIREARALGRPPPPRLSTAQLNRLVSGVVRSTARGEPVFIQTIPTAPIDISQEDIRQRRALRRRELLDRGAIEEISRLPTPAPRADIRPARLLVEGPDEGQIENTERQVIAGFMRYIEDIEGAFKRIIRDNRQIMTVAEAVEIQQLTTDLYATGGTPYAQYWTEPGPGEVEGIEAILNPFINATQDDLNERDFREELIPLIEQVFTEIKDKGLSDIRNFFSSQFMDRATAPPAREIPPGLEPQQIERIRRTGNGRFYGGLSKPRLMRQRAVIPYLEERNFMYHRR